MRGGQTGTRQMARAQMGRCQIGPWPNTAGRLNLFFLFKPFVRCTLGSSGHNKIKQNLSFAQSAASGSCRKVRSPSPAPLHLQETPCFHTFCAIQEFWPLKASRALPGMGQEGAFCTKWLGSLTPNLGENGDRVGTRSIQQMNDIGQHRPTAYKSP